MSGDVSTEPGLPSPGHAVYDELTAGYALDALEPGEEEQLLAHLPGCARCRAALAQHHEVAGHLAMSFPARGDAPAAGPALTALFASRAPGEMPDDPFEAPEPAAAPVPAAEPAPASLASAAPALPRPRTGGLRHRTRRVLVGAGALALAAVLGLSSYDVHLRRHHAAPTGDQAALAALADPSAAVAHLAGARHASATAVVADGHAWLVATDLPATTAQCSYVVWQLADGRATALASFTASGTRMPQVVDLGGAPTRDSTAYAVTLEPQPATAPLPATAHGPFVLQQA